MNLHRIYPVLLALLCCFCSALSVSAQTSTMPGGRSEPTTDQRVVGTAMELFRRGEIERGRKVIEAVDDDFDASTGRYRSWIVPGRLGAVAAGLHDSGSPGAGMVVARAALDEMQKRQDLALVGRSESTAYWRLVGQLREMAGVDRSEIKAAYAKALESDPADPISFERFMFLDSVDQAALEKEIGNQLLRDREAEEVRLGIKKQ